MPHAKRGPVFKASMKLGNPKLPPTAVANSSAKDEFPHHGCAWSKDGSPLNGVVTVLTSYFVPSTVTTASALDVAGNMQIVAARAKPPKTRIRSLLIRRFIGISVRVPCDGNPAICGQFTPAYIEAIR